MPSSVSAKPEKQPSAVSSADGVASNPAAATLAVPENAAAAQPPAVDNSSPIRQVMVIIEHKIRNLEKRKVGIC